ADRLAADLAGAQLRRPQFPVVANVTGAPVEEPQEIRRLLFEQVTSPVRWHDGIRWMLKQGMRQCYEVGPGRVLQGLLRRIDPQVTCATVGGADDVRACAEAIAH
ncbi:MAG: hypothetical protein AMK73_00185, partial [Planctomycetes bacterium SM23_32]